MAGDGTANGTAADRTLFLRGNPTSLTKFKDSAQSYYQSLGEGCVEKVKLAQKDGQTANFGWLIFKDAALARRALDMDRPEVDGKQLLLFLKRSNQKDKEKTEGGKGPGKRAGDLLHSNKMKRRALGEAFRKDFASGKTLVPIKWTDEMLKEAPFRKDFSSLLVLPSRSEDEIKKFRRENHIQLFYKSPKQETEGPDKPMMLVIVPTREMVLQIAGEMGKYNHKGLRIGVAYGGRGGADVKKKNEEKMAMADTLMKGVDIVVACTGRLIEFVEAGILKLDNVTYLVVDDADLLMDLGFLPQLNAIAGQIRPDRQTLMFSATWSTDVQALAKQFLKEPLKVVVNRAEDSVANKNVQHEVVWTGTLQEKDDKMMEIIAALKSAGLDQTRVFVFANNQSWVEAVVAMLQTKWPNVYFIHGKKSQDEREEALAKFRSDPHSIMVSTDVGCRGLDFKGLPCVINYQLPFDLDRMVQRIGRTGRAGQKGRAYSFFSERDCPRAPMLVKCIEKTGVAAPQFLHLEAKKAKTIKSRHKKKEQDEGEWPAGDGAANGGTEWWAAEAAEEPAAEAQAQAPAPQSATEEGAEAGAEVVEVVPVQPIKETKEKKDKEKKKEKAPAADGEVDGGAMEGGAEAGAGDLEVVPVQPIKEKKEKKDKEKKKEKASAADGEVDGGEAGAENGLPGEKKKKKSSEGDAEAEVPEKKAKKARRL